ncbi:hypothetical protein ACGF5O_28265 [Streptomyces sp. NPDC048291]|uniref:hypothetical protein n=1 Tax=Streptomyces sp. NPDC048291 TaxID=3365530 RepID=UPI00370FF870
MNHLGDAHLRTWTLRFMALLAADVRTRFAWPGKRELETDSAVEALGLLCRVSEGLAERGAFEPEDLRDLQAIGRCLAELDATRRTGLWANSLATDPAWDAIRPLARRLLITTLGDWRQALPRPVGPPTGQHSATPRRKNPAGPLNAPTRRVIATRGVTR